MIYALTNGGLYACLSILIGASLLSMFNEELAHRRNTWALFALAVPVLALYPVIELSFSLQEYREGGFLSSFFHVLTQLKGGQAWLLLLGLSILQVVVLKTIRRPKVVYSFSLLFIVGMILIQSVTGHSASINSAQGALFHTIHFIAVGVWSGILLVMSFLSGKEDRWDYFVDWFTKVAIGCMVWIVVTGVAMSLTLTESIVGSWMLSYGQALLVKHLLFIVLLLFAFVNGFLIKRLVGENKNFSPKSWWKAESLLIVSIYTITGYMTEQETPHNITQTLKDQEPSALFRMFTTVDGVGPLTIAPNVISISLVGLAFVFLLFAGMMVKRNSVAGTFFVSLMMIVSLYFGFMSSVTMS
ncbi:copper resistance D family protein [Salimicrobium salexigens]|uniref:Copper resistance protein D n=1 Tax=Salimicrobium salexigens TaxID=908941 RepID=A0ABY1KZS9_9BACI|nr:CopD family protein [Salimicrobium salexigens]SIS98462.1 putative copper resistance protein D [Salimicrobium salexigens]